MTSRHTQVAICVAMLGIEGCILRREALSGGVDAPEDAFTSVEDAPADAWAPDAAQLPDAHVVPDACTPSCVDDKLDNCMGETTSCLLGCVAGVAACREMVLSNVDEPDVMELVRMSTESLRVVEPRVIGDCATSRMTLHGQRVCLHVYADVTISAPLTFNGTLPVILIGRDFLHVTDTGVIHASARRGTPGPGGAGPGAGALRGTDGNHSGAYDDGGGGGGGSCGAGGGGGRGGDASGGNGGGALGRTELQPLVGGSGGGSGPGDGGDPGAGGGAVQLSSLREIVFAGAIYVGGGAGQRGIQSGNYGAGGGGGSGGSILLEAPIMNLTGARLVATGGGGGGSSGLTGSGSDGSDGTSFTGGGGGSGGLGASGGAGSIEGTGTGGSSNTDTWGNGGGGGGGVGTIVLRHAELSPSSYASPSLAPCFWSLALRSR